MSSAHAQRCEVTIDQQNVRHGGSVGLTRRSACVQVPLFVEEGMLIEVDAQEGKYLKRVK